jgi:hypothetical protein
MTLHLQYISDDKGNPSAVIIPINEWNSILKQINVETEDKEPTKEQILKGIKDGLREVKLIRSGKRKQKSLKAFLNEL